VLPAGPADCLYYCSVIDNLPYISKMMSVSVAVKKFPKLMVIMMVGRILFFF